MKLKLQLPEGSQVVDLPNDATLQSLLGSIQGINVGKIRCGYPPQLVSLDDTSVALSDLGVKNGDQLKVESSERKVASPPPPSSSTSKAQEEDTNKQQVPCGEGFLKLRVMEDDNSCLFRAVGYACMGGSYNASELRERVASAIQHSPDRYNEAILGRPREEYMAWIRKSSAWGGDIELAILSEHFGVTIYCYDIKHDKSYTINDGQSRFVIVMYSGIHYDTVALNPLEHEDIPDLDQTKFENDETGLMVANALSTLGAKLNSMNYYTDTQNFSLQCNICKARLVGEKDATNHAMKTGHQEFGEYKPSQ